MHFPETYNTWRLVPRACLRTLLALLCYGLSSQVASSDGAFRSSQAAESWGLQYHGVLSSGGMIRGKAPVGATLTLNGKAVDVSEEGFFVLGFGRDTSGEQVFEASLPGKPAWRETWQVPERNYQIQRIEGIKQNIMSPSEENLKRIREEVAMTRKARQVKSTQPHYRSDFIWPLSGPITGVYGSQRFYNGEPRRPHFGIDIAAPTGTPVVAPASGVITLSHPDMFYSGGTIILDHGMGVSSTFIHLSRVLVEEGQKISQGDILGEVGAGGRATGPHLDWRINWYDERLDPGLLMQAVPMPKQNKN